MAEPLGNLRIKHGKVACVVMRHLIKIIWHAVLTGAAVVSPASVVPLWILLLKIAKRQLAVGSDEAADPRLIYECQWPVEAI